MKKVCIHGIDLDFCQVCFDDRHEPNCLIFVCTCGKGKK